MVLPARLACCLLFGVSFGGCGHIPPALVSLDGSTVDDPSRVARLAPDPSHPLLLRGLDGVAVGVRVPNVFHRFSYVFAAGRHTLWASSIPAGLPWLPQAISCYVIEVELEKGAGYLLAEDRERGRAIVLLEDSRREVASGAPVDRPWVFERNCRWQ